MAAEDFEHTDHQMLFELIRESVEQDKTEQHEFVVESLPEITAKPYTGMLSAQAEKPERMEEKAAGGLIARCDQIASCGGWRKPEPVAIPAGGSASEW